MSMPKNGDTSHDAHEKEPRLSRRLFLKSSGAAAAGASISIPVAGQQGTATPGATPEASGEGNPAVLFFNAWESSMVDALTNRLIPGSPDDPGAREAGVLYFIDRTLSGPNEGYSLKTYIQGPYLAVSEQESTVESTSRSDLYRVVPVSSKDAPRYGYQSVLTPQDIYRRGLKSVDAYAQSTFNASFLDLTDDQQDSILTDMEADKAEGFEAPSGQAFFAKLRNDTIQGMFSDPMYGGNRNLAGWKLIGYPGPRGYYTADDIANASFSMEPVSLDTTGHQH